MIRVVAALVCGHVDWVVCDKARVTGAEPLPETLWCGHCGSWQPLIEFVTDPGELDPPANTPASSPDTASGMGERRGVESPAPLMSRATRKARSMREELTTDLYHLNRIRRHDWDTTIMALLRYGPRRPGDVVAAAVGWQFYDPWEGRTRELAESRVRESLSTLVKLGLAEKDSTARSGRDIEYKLTPAGEEYIAVMEQEREWLARHPDVLDNAVCAFREDQRSRLAGHRYRSSRRSPIVDVVSRRTRAG